MAANEVAEVGPRQFNGDFQTDFLSVDQLTLEDLNQLHLEADAMQWMAWNQGVSDVLEGRVYDLVFWDSNSTRTKMSFIHAIKRLGGKDVPFDQSSSSSGKGETFADTIEMIDSYLIPERDAIIVRHNKVGNVALAAEIADAPVLNAGDGAGEHPTQAVLDTQTIRKRFPNLEDVHIAFFGDLAYARTVNSSAPLLAKMGVRQMSFVGPHEDLRASDMLIQRLKFDGVHVTESDDLREVAKHADVIYGLRTQYELRNPDDKAAQAEDRERLGGLCRITPDKVEGSDAVWMHPLPEDQADLNIVPELRRDPRCIYKEQAGHGEWTRMALLARLAGTSLVPQYFAMNPDAKKPNLVAIK